MEQIIEIKEPFDAAARILSVESIPEKVSMVTIEGSIVSIHSPDFQHQGSSPFGKYAFDISAEDILPHLSNFIRVDGFNSYLPTGRRFSDEELISIVYSQAECFADGRETDVGSIEPFTAYVNPKFYDGIQDCGTYRKLSVRCGSDIFTLTPKDNLQTLFASTPRPPERAHEPR